MSHETRRLFDVAVERVPADVVVVLAATVAADLGLLLLSPGPLRFGLALPLLFAFPGYAVVSGLFPARIRRSGVDIDALERVALALPVSLGVLAVVGLVLASTGAGLTAGGVLAALSGVVLWGSLVTVLRRGRIPADRRFDPSPGALVDGVRSLPDRFDDGTEAGATLALAGAVVVAAVSVGAAVAVPPEPAGHDSLHLLTEGADGEPVAGGYPDTVARGEPVELVVGVDNEFAAEQSYTVVVVLERVGPGGAVTDRFELDRLAASVAAGERWTRSHEVRPPTTGEDLRLSYLLFEGSAPDRPTRADARHTTHVWVTVEAA